MVVVTGQRGEMKILRQTDAAKSEKNDGMVALVMALKEAALQPIPMGHVYDRREVMVL
jgi:hypothetical protein